MPRLEIRLLLACLLFSFVAPAMAQVPKLEVAVTRADVDDQNVFEVSASGAVNASPAVVWKILTNYERMPEFVPDLQTSRILSRNGNEVIVEQFGVARLLFLSRDIHLVVRITEQPMTTIDIAIISGDMKTYVCRWQMLPLAETGGTRIVYSGKLVPKFYVPGMLGASLIRGDVQRMMTAVLARLDKPDPAGSQAGPASIKPQLPSADSSH
jgi:ribosome-associated toxin RatA of RatAB toxin-antitoxin module